MRLPRYILYKINNNSLKFIGLARAPVSVKSWRIYYGLSQKNNQTKANTLVASRHYRSRVRAYFGFNLVYRLRGSGKSDDHNPQRYNAYLNTTVDMDALFLPLAQAHSVAQFRRLGWRDCPVFRLFPVQPIQREHDADVRMAMDQAQLANRYWQRCHSKWQFLNQAIVFAVPRAKPGLLRARPRVGR